MLEKLIVESVRNKIQNLEISTNERLKVEMLAVKITRDYLKKLPKTNTMASPSGVAFNCVYIACILLEIPIDKYAVGPQDRHHVATTQSTYRDIITKLKISQNYNTYKLSKI